MLVITVFGGVDNYCLRASYMGLFVKIHQATSLWSAYFSACMRYLHPELTLKIKCLVQCLPTES